MTALWLVACMSLDGFFFNPEVTDAYDLRADVIPASAVEEVTFQAADGTALHGVWAHQDPPAAPMIFFHGNTGNIATEWDRVETYWSWGRHDVLAVDYRGYGRSEGSPTYDGVVEQDGLAAVDYVAATTGLDPSEIPWMGHSLGACIATHTSDEIAAQSIVLESMFASADHLADDATGMDYPSGWFFEDPFDNVEAIGHLTSPVFIVHGLADDYILPEYADELFDAAPDPKELWKPEGVGHSDIVSVIPDDYEARITSYQDAWTTP